MSQRNPLRPLLLGTAATQDRQAEVRRLGQACAPMARRPLHASHALLVLVPQHVAILFPFEADAMHSYFHWPSISSPIFAWKTSRRRRRDRKWRSACPRPLLISQGASARNAKCGRSWRPWWTRSRPRRRTGVKMLVAGAYQQGSARSHAPTTNGSNSSGPSSNPIAQHPLSQRNPLRILLLGTAATQDRQAEVPRLGQACAPMARRRFMRHTWYPKV